MIVDCPLALGGVCVSVVGVDGDAEAVALEHGLQAQAEVARGGDDEEIIAGAQVLRADRFGEAQLDGKWRRADGGAVCRARECEDRGVIRLPLDTGRLEEGEGRRGQQGDGKDEGGSQAASKRHDGDCITANSCEQTDAVLAARRGGD